jgi:hypothetical protein
MYMNWTCSLTISQIVSHEQEALLNNKGNGRYKHNGSKKRAIAVKHCASMFTAALPHRLEQLEANKQKEGSRMAVFHRQTSDLSESDIRQMNHADMSDEDDESSDDDYFGEEDLFSTPERKPKRGKPGSKSPASRSPASKSPASRSPANSTSMRKPVMKPKSNLRTSDVSGSLTPEPGNALTPTPRRTRGGANMFDVVNKTYEHHVAKHDLFAEFMATGPLTGVGQRAGRGHPQPVKPELMRLTSNDKYVLDYGARFRDLMEDTEMSTEAKCWRLYA